MSCGSPITSNFVLSGFGTNDFFGTLFTDLLKVSIYGGYSTIRNLKFQVQLTVIYVT